MTNNKNISNQEKKQEIAKGLLIKFIIFMICLTIISKVFSSIITPIVYVENIKSDVITKKITGSGTIKADSKININFKEQFLVDKIYYGIGEEVKSGNPLIRFDKANVDESLKKLETELKKLELELNKLELDTSSTTRDTTLEDSKKKLETLKRDKDIALKKEDDKINNAKKGILDAQNILKEKEQDILKVKNNYEKVKKDLLKDNQKLKQDKIKEAEGALEKSQKDLDDKNYEKSKALQKARQTLDEANSSLYDPLTGEYIPQNYNNVKRAEMDYEFTKKDYERVINDINKEIEKAKENLEKIKNTSDEDINKKELTAEEEKVKLAEDAVKSARDNLKEKQGLLEDANYNKNIAADDYNIKIEDANKNIEYSKVLEKENKIKDNNNIKKQNIDKEILKLSIQDKKDYILKLKQLIQNDYCILSPINGIISSVNAKEGEHLQKENVVSLVDSNTKYVFEVFLSEGEAKNIDKQDSANIKINSKVFEDIPIYKILDSIEEKKNGKIVSFLLEEGKPNDEGKMEIIKESKQYQTVIPKDAIRMESNIEYVLVVRQKETMIGNKTLAIKVEINKLEEGDRLVAIEGDFEPGDKIIVDSNKNINENDTVRIGEK